MNELASKILKKSEDYRNYSASNLSKLIQIKSLSCDEKNVQLELRTQLEVAGCEEVWVDGIGNVIGKIGKGKKIIVFDGHVDTVDVGNTDNWNSDPFSGEIKDGFVHGRGAADQKGGVASFVTAAKIIKEIGVPENCTVYFVGSVIEEDCDGLCWKYILENDHIKPDIVVSTEPTSLNIYRGHRGRMEINVSFKGISAHGSAPERGKNAIYNASKACLEIEKLNENLANHDFLGKGSITISEFISGSPSLCAVADYAKIHIDRRLTLGETKESALEEIRQIVKDLDAEVFVLNYNAKAFTGLNYGMEKFYPVWLLEDDNKFVKSAKMSYQKLFGKNPETGRWTFSTNGTVINGLYQIPVIGFGPGDEVMAHAPNEKIKTDDLVVASAFYAMFVYTLNAEIE